MLSYNPIFKVCTIEMTMGGRDQETVMLLPHKMNMRLSRNSSNQEKSRAFSLQHHQVGADPKKQ